MAYENCFSDFWQHDALYTGRGDEERRLWGRWSDTGQLMGMVELHGFMKEAASDASSWLYSADAEILSGGRVQQG